MRNELRGPTRGGLVPARGWLGLLLVAIAAMSAVAPVACAEELPTASPPLTAPDTPPAAPCTLPPSLLPRLPDEDGTADPVPAVSNVSFIDPASPWNVVRLRLD